MTEKKKLIYGVVGSVVAILVGTFLYDKLKKKPPIPPNPYNPTDNGGGGGGGSPQDNFNPSPYAYALYEAMDGWGTTESVVREIADMQQAPQIAQWFDANKGQFEGETLKEWIEGDFGSSEASTLNGKFGY
jgi:hypothetical protein